MSSAADNSNISLMNVYAPEGDARILVVLVPAMETSLTELRYRELLAQRLLRLMQLWEEEVGVMNTHNLLMKAARELELDDPYPKQPKSMRWQDWARFLAQENNLIPDRFAWLGIDFPVTIEQNPDQIEWLKALFAEPDIQPNLPEWLGEAMYKPLYGQDYEQD
jgi:hypothetical protein